VYQQPPGFEGEPDYSRDLEAALRGAQTLLEVEAAAIEADGGPPAETEAIGGSQPGQTIVDATASGQYDLLVMGTRGLGRLGSTFLGSVSAHAARIAPSRSSWSTEPTDARSSARSRVDAAQRPGGDQVRAQPRLHVAVRTIRSWC